MTSIRISAWGTLSAVLLVSAAAHGAATPAAKCQSKKLIITANYGTCRLKAQAKAVKDESMAGLPTAFAKCEAKFTKRWTAAETRGGAACPTTGDSGPLEARTFEFAQFVGLQLDAVRFIDNGNGTVTDTRTGLQWEKKQFDDGEADYSNPHDVNNLYTWSTTGTAPDGTAFTQFLGALNTCTSPFGDDGFAGHCDWRLPTYQELQSIFDNTIDGCPGVVACVDPIFIPTALPFGNGFGPHYWSSISGGTDALAWGFDHTSCTCPKSTPNWVRAVRGGQGPTALP